MSCLVVNLFGVPSAGKSTLAAYIFSQLKMANVNAELVTEFAKDKVWENNSEVFKPDNQCYLFSKQLFRMNRVADKVEVMITDSPLPLCILYNKSEILGENFNRMCMSCFNSFTNFNYLLTRDRPYNPKGRWQTEEESDALKKPLVDLLTKYDIGYIEKPGNMKTGDYIVNEIINALSNQSEV
jgi:GTPase SAR1 family protein